MADEMWNAMVPTPDEEEVRKALERVRGRVTERRVQSGQRRRLLALAAAFALTFSAGLVAGRVTAPAGHATRMWAVGGSSMEALRGSFVVVPAQRHP